MSPAARRAAIAPEYHWHSINMFTTGRQAVQRRRSGAVPTLLFGSQKRPVSLATAANLFFSRSGRLLARRWSLHSFASKLRFSLQFTSFENRLLAGQSTNVSH